jgi:uncharacterized protein with von Willebrand factor type A (vWA) domain
VPPSHPAETFLRDLGLLVDAGGSMSGNSLECCKRLGRALLSGLAPRDRVELLAFDSDVQRFSDRPEPVSDALKMRALAWIDALRAGGATEMTDAVIAALAPLCPGS